MEDLKALIAREKKEVVDFSDCLREKKIFIKTSQYVNEKNFSGLLQQQDKQFIAPLYSALELRDNCGAAMVLV